MPFETLDPPDLAQPTIAMLQTSSLTSAVQQALERMITLGELGPGDKLNEAALAERLGVSRGPVREAFRVLEEAGLLTLKKNRGVFVRQIPLHEALEIYELRAMMEAHVGAVLAEAASEEQLASLQAMIDSMERAVQAAAEVTANPVFCSTKAMALSDGIWTHAEMTTMSTPLVLSRSTSAKSARGSRRPTARLSSIPRAIESTTDMPWSAI